MSFEYPNLAYVHELTPYFTAVSAGDLLFVERGNGDGTYRTHAAPVSAILSSRVDGPANFVPVWASTGQGLVSSNISISGVTVTVSGNQIITGNLSATYIYVPVLNANTINSNTGNYITVNATNLNSTLITSTTGQITTLTATDIIVQNLSAANIVNIEVTPNTLFVSTSGSDSWIGTNSSAPFRTIKKACAYAAANLSTPYTVYVQTGDYTEQNPIYVSSNTTILGDNLRRTTIRPANKFYDILWCTNSIYVWGFTFRDHLEPSAACAFPNLNNARPDYQVAFNTPGYTVTAPVSRPFITTSPYIQGCSSITSGASGYAAGCGIRVDGDLVTGYLRSFVTDSFTQFNQGGLGIHILNNGYAQLVSTFTICCSAGILVESGGTCSVNTSNCSFGTYGLVAIGKSLTPVLTGILVTNTPVNSDTISISGVTPRTYPTYNPPVNEPYIGLVFEVEGDPTNTTWSIQSVSSTNLSSNSFNVQSIDAFTAPLSSGSKVNFYIRSTITSSSHTMEYVGSGNQLVTAVPALGGKANPNNISVELSGGAVYVTSTDQSGNFRVGQDFTIVQSTGVIQGETFNRSILALVTPLTLALE